MIVKHGKTNTRLYRIFKYMKERCYSSKNKDFNYYGGRGIGICKNWLEDFNNFYNWSIENGYNDTLTIDRIDTNKDYEPSNCRWVDMTTQNRNRRNNRIIAYNNETHCLAEWCEMLNINKNTLRKRLDRGWSVEKAFTTPVKSKP